jgi:hypothetical protein
MYVSKLLSHPISSLIMMFN